MESHRESAGTLTALEYPDPPRVHWFVLFLAQAALGYLVDQFTPDRFHDLLDSLIIDVWAFYLMLWIHQINPESRCIFWCDAYLAVELSYAAMMIHQHPSDVYKGISDLLSFGSLVLGLVAIYSVRNELLKQYNEREHYGLYLGPVMTFFFSYLYFQSHLYEIAKRKREERREAHLRSNYLVDS